jgi:hypothetical protein
MRKWLILLSALAATGASAAPAWTWVDENGTVHFSDRPVPGARQVEISGAQGFTTQGPTRAPRVLMPRETSTAPYERVEIASPAEQETLWNIGAMLNVQTTFVPALQPGHRYDLVLDGQRRNLNTTSASVVLPEVFRGEHTLEVVVLDGGREIMRSPPRTFYVQQTSALNPNSRTNRAN